MDGFVGTESLYITIKGEEDDGLTFEYRQDWDGGGAGLRGPKMSRIKGALHQHRLSCLLLVYCSCYWCRSCHEKNYGKRGDSKNETE